MSLIEKSIDTYDTNADIAGKVIPGQPPLAPVAHEAKPCDVEITLNSAGDFISACETEKNDRSTIIPITIEGVSRTGNIAPLPLCDQFKYSCSRYDKQRYNSFLIELEKWVDSVYTHPIPQAVLKYVKKDTLIADLTASGYFGQELDKLDEKIEDCAKDRIRWRVTEIGEEEACWKNTILFKRYIDYYDEVLKHSGNTNLCMATGEYTMLSRTHPKAIVAHFGQAKLVTMARNGDILAYRGEATGMPLEPSVGYIASQKAHNALKWLLHKDNTSRYYRTGGNAGERVFAVWNTHNHQVPKLFEWAMLPEEKDRQWLDPMELSSYFDDKELPICETMDDYKEALKEALYGYQQKLPDEEDVEILVVDAAVQGRLSIIYYSELRAFEYLARMMEWNSQCVWTFGPKGIRSPALTDIIDCTYGEESNKRLKVRDLKLYDREMARLMSCRLVASKIPDSIVRKLEDNIERRYRYKSRNNWLRILETTCAVLRWNMYIDAGRKDVSYLDALDINSKDRSYQYGRLMALVEKAERDQFKSDVYREPTIMRFLKEFIAKPESTMAKIVWPRVQSWYLSRLPVGKRNWYQAQINQVYSALAQTSDYDESQKANGLDKRLEMTYLMGYQLQRNALYTKKKSDEDDKDTINEEN